LWTALPEARKVCEILVRRSERVAAIAPERWQWGIADMILTPISPLGEILRACALLMKRGDVHEVRVPKAGSRGTISGYFDNAEALAKAVLPLDGTVPGIYITLNPVQPALLARAANRLRERAPHATNDTDIACRRRLLVDFDPIRPTGVSSSDSEHGRALTVACGAWDDLRMCGFRDPVVADSGNGAHLLYPLDLPNDQTATDQVKHALAGIAVLCGTDDVNVDLTVFNAARIVKLYGTMTCKGDSLRERPHRRSRLLEIPPHWE
jgi:hypothetical protein